MVCWCVEIGTLSPPADGSPRKGNKQRKKWISFYKQIFFHWWVFVTSGDAVFKDGKIKQQTLYSCCQRSLWKQKACLFFMYIRSAKKCFVQAKMLMSPCVPLCSQFIPFFPLQVHIARSSVTPKQTQQTSFPGSPPLLLRLSELANSPVGSGFYLFVSEHFSSLSFCILSLLYWSKISIQCWSSPFFFSFYTLQVRALFFILLHKEHNGQKCCLSVSQQLRYEMALRCEPQI